MGINNRRENSMKAIKLFLILLFLGFLLSLLTSCETVAVYGRPGHGPPAHAKAHGWRNKQHDTVVIVDVDH